MRMLSVGVVALGVVLAGPVVSAHHSFSAEFDIDQPVTLKGTLTELEWVNPHGWIHMDVAGPDGAVVNWAVEMGNPTALLRRGLRRSDFPPGTEIVVDGYKAKGRDADRERHHHHLPRRPERVRGLVGNRGAGAESLGVCVVERI